MDFMGLDPQQLQLTATLGDAVRRWVRHRYPRDTAKHLARDLQCDVRTAENIADGHLSATSLTRLIRTYGWVFLADVGTAVIGETYEHSINREIMEIADERRQLEAREAGLRNRYGALRARRAVGAGGLRLVPEEDPDARREAGR